MTLSGKRFDAKMIYSYFFLLYSIINLKFVNSYKMYSDNITISRSRYIFISTVSRKWSRVFRPVNFRGSKDLNSTFLHFSKCEKRADLILDEVLIRRLTSPQSWESWVVRFKVNHTDLEFFFGIFSIFETFLKIN